MDKEKIQGALNKYLEIHQRIYELMFYLNSRKSELETVIKQSEMEITVHKIELEKAKKELDEQLT